MRRRVADPSRVGNGGQRRIMTPGKARGERPLELDDCPTELVPSHDKKWLYALLPYGILVIPRDGSQVERQIELAHASPSVSESADSQLWVGGHHLFHAHAFSGRTHKFGSKLAGFVDQIVCLSDGRRLFGIGSHGEVLLDVQDERTLFQHEQHRHHPCSVALALDDTLVFADGHRHAMIVDPNYTDGYTQLNFKTQNDWEDPAQAILKVARGYEERLILAAADGAIAWTGPGARIEREYFLYSAATDEQRRPLAVAGDARWIYVLRPRGELQRFLMTQPPPPPSDMQKKHGGRRVMHDPLPDAQTCRLGKIASAMTLFSEAPEHGYEAPKTRIVLAGPRADGYLGQLWTCDPEALEWKPLRLSQRELSEKPESHHEAPSFVPTKHKFQGAALSELSVDDVMTSTEAPWILHGNSTTLLDRSIRPVGSETILPADTLVIPAMLRFTEGTARPGFVVWMGLAEARGPLPPLRFFCWGDDPRGWMELDTPSIRAQKWSRTDVFPLQVALRSCPKEIPDSCRVAISDRWRDQDLFDAMAQECRHQLKVIW